MSLTVQSCFQFSIFELGRSAIRLSLLFYSVFRRIIFLSSWIVGLDPFVFGHVDN